MIRNTLSVVLGLTVTLSLLVGLGSISLATSPCEVNGPDVGQSAETGGTLITYTVHCTGNRTIDDEVTVRLEDQTLFKAADTYEVSGNATATKEIHLPPPPVLPGAEVCVRVDDIEHCVGT